MPLKRKLFNAILGLTSLAATACGPHENCYQDRNYLNITNYEIIVAEYTPKGIGIDQPDNFEYRLDPSEIDWQVDDLESCLNNNFKDHPVIAPEEYKDA